MKLQNLRRFDLAEQGKGLPGGGRLEEDIWATFADDPQRLAMVAAAIRNGAALLSAPSPLDTDGLPIFEADEGEVVTRRHLARERNRTIVERKKADAFAKKGNLACEACGFDFTAHYGDRGQGFIECHHLAPLSDAAGSLKTKLSDLALICANCHRMIHIRRPWLTLAELQAAISNAG